MPTANRAVRERVDGRAGALDRLGGTLRATRYGEVLDPGTSANLDFELGAENVFDAYPGAFPVTRNTTGNTPYSNYAPFGRTVR